MNEPVIRVNNLGARDEFGAIRGVSLALPSQPVGALIGSLADGASALCAVLAGAIRPVAGKVAIAGQDPRRSPALRRRMGVLLPEPELPNLGKVRDLLTLARKLREGEQPRESWFSPLGLDALANRSIPSLTRGERRTLGLALALAVPHPIALVLFDPLAEVAQATPTWLRTELEQRASQGSCVLVITPSSHDAVALAGDVALIEQGRIGHVVGQPEIDRLLPGGPVELWVWTDKKRDFGSLLLREEAILSLIWAEDQDTPLRIRGTNMQQCARTVVRVAVESGISLQSIQAVVPDASQIKSALRTATIHHELSSRGQS